jgi:hypothetical protein
MIWCTDYSRSEAVGLCLIRGSCTLPCQSSEAVPHRGSTPSSGAAGHFLARISEAPPHLGNEALLCKHLKILI